MSPNQTGQDVASRFHRTIVLDYLWQLLFVLLPLFRNLTLRISRFAEGVEAEKVGRQEHSEVASNMNMPGEMGCRCNCWY